jgi:hypothetical protein
MERRKPLRKYLDADTYKMLEFTVVEAHKYAKKNKKKK